MRLIDLDELLKFPLRLDHYDTENGDIRYVYGIEAVLEYAEYLPTVDAVPVRHGRWTADESMYTVGEAQCSVCKTTFYADDLYCVGEKAQSEMPNYCPHCGAKMDAEREEK